MRKSQLIAILIAVLSAISSYGQTGLRPRGDVNCDWEVGIADVNVLVDAVLEGVDYHPFYTYAYDINGDKEINLADINLIVDAVLGGQLMPLPSYSGTLPVLYINTEGYRDIVSKDEYLQAEWWLDASPSTGDARFCVSRSDTGYESIGSADEPLGMQIKGRGNYTWRMYDKKSFRLKLDDKQPLMGMHSNRHWCLMAHPDDFLARLKNTMGFEMSRRIGLAYTPAQEPVEVVLNGQYIGLYFLTEKIRVDKHRVNIEEQTDGETNPDKITGGWLLEITNVHEDNTLYFLEQQENDRWLGVTPESPENLSWHQERYIRNFIQKTNDAIYTDDTTSTEWEKYIDIDALAKYYIVGEIMDDLEHFAGSCYMHKHRGDSTKLIFGPVWDFGNAFQRWAIYGDTEFNKFIYQQPTSFNNHWIEKIAQFPHFQQVVKEHWQDFYESDFNGLDLDGFIDEFVESIRPAYQADAARWKQRDIESEKKNFKNFIHRKIDWLNSQWGKPQLIPTNLNSHLKKNDNLELL